MGKILWAGRRMRLVGLVVGKTQKFLALWIYSKGKLVLLLKGISCLGDYYPIESAEWIWNTETEDNIFSPPSIGSMTPSGDIEISGIMQPRSISLPSFHQAARLEVLRHGDLRFLCIGIGNPGILGVVLGTQHRSAFRRYSTKKVTKKYQLNLQVLTDNFL